MQTILKATNIKARILVVDDEYLIGKSITELLEYFGFTADYKQSSSEALEFLDHHPETDIVLLDINLGTDFSGIDLIPIIKEKNRFVQIIMFTSEDSLETGVECMRKGAFDYMTKPFDDAAFLSKVPGALERKKSLQLSDLYLGILFHDMKNPLQGVMGSLELLQMSLSEPLSPRQEKSFKQASLCTKQILMMINNIVSVAKFESGTVSTRRETFVIQEEIEEPLSHFLALADDTGARRLALSYLPGNPISLCADKDLFFRVLVNMVSNAFRYSDEGSVVAVDIIEDDLETIHVSVTNTGSYIDEPAREGIFNKFSSVQPSTGKSGMKNYGLGLTFSKMAVEAMNGQIWISGDPALPSTTFHYTVRKNPD